MISFSAIAPRPGASDPGAAVESAPAPPEATASRGGEQAAFEVLYQRHFRAVYRWCRALGAPERDLEDLTQDVFAVVHRKVGAFDGRHPEAWLYEIARRTVSDYRRRAWFRSLLSRGDLVDAQPEGEGRRPDALLAAERERDRFWRLVARLDERLRVPLVLFEIEGCPGEEIAAALGIPLKTVWTRLHKGRRRLADLVRAEVGDPQGAPSVDGGHR